MSDRCKACLCALYVMSFLQIFKNRIWLCCLGMVLIQAIVLSFLYGLLMVLWPSLTRANVAVMEEIALWLELGLLTVLTNVWLAYKSSCEILAGHQQVSRRLRIEIQRNRWFAVAQHDLWQPLKSVQLYAAAIAQAAPADQARLLTGMQLAALHVEEFMNHLGTWSEQQALELTKPGQEQQLSAHDLLSPLVEECMPLAHWHRVSLHYRKNDSHVLVNTFAVQRMLRNLVHNALTYTPAGGRVLIGCRRRSGYLWIWCVDNGRGMSAQQLALCTQAYSRFATTGNDMGHQGLGLFSFYQLANQMKLPVRMKSTPGRGSLFGFAVPLA